MFFIYTNFIFLSLPVSLSFLFLVQIKRQVCEFVQAIIPNLTVNTVYEIMVRGATRSTIDSRLIIQGDSSMPTKVLVTRDCDKIPPLMRRSSKDLSAGVIAGMVCACFAVMLAITSFVLWK